jgi:microcystin-dependent protein
MAYQIPTLRFREFDANGDPLAGGKVYTYAAGTTTPLATYTTAAAAVENANPVILDANGRGTIYLSSSSYKIVVKDANDVVQYTEDNIAPQSVDSGFTTGDVKTTLKIVADSGWVLMDDKTIGNNASSATGRANDDTEALFTLLWNNTANADCAVSTGRGASAAADFAANKTIALPKTLGRALAGYGSGSGLTARALAAITGVESHVLTEAQMPSHTHTQVAHDHTDPGHSHGIWNQAVGTATASSGVANDNRYAVVDVSGANANAKYNAMSAELANVDATTAVNQNAGSGSAHPNMQPTVFMNFMVKL